MYNLSSFSLNNIDNNVYYKLRSITKFHIRDIFANYWDSFLDTFPSLRIRDIVFEEVTKVINCGTINLGYTMYECKHCDNYTIVPHTCKSRFCSSCGNKYVNTRVINSKSKLMNIKHRHIVFTIPDSLRNLFLVDRIRINLLFESVIETFNWIFNPVSFHNKQKKKQLKRRNKRIKRVNKDSCLVPGIICVLHTYGRDLKWNPHIHVLITEGGLKNSSMSFRRYNHFNYETLRKTFQKILLDKLYYLFGPSFYFTKCRLYKEYNNGFYVYAHNRQFSNIQKGTEYVMRYSGKPAMAESRITNVDYDNDSITYWYDDHKTHKRVTVTEHVFDLFAKIICHIPNKHFKTIRYYGLYAAKNHRYSSYYEKLHKLEKIRALMHLMKKTYRVTPIRGKEDE